LLTNGNLFIGNYKNELMDEGNIYELQPDSSYSMFEVKFDYESDLKNGISGPS
jgi:hypothetical protein